jgi:protein-S-isoprenylcysteine O-methyltransferase Ste14
MIGPTGIVLFVLLSGAAVAASVHAWRAHETYGLFRFLGFELLAALVGWNTARWFRDPLSGRQLLSWILLIASLGLAVHGSHLLRSIGRAQRRVMEETQAIVETGAYRYIRHPLYASLLFFVWGAFLKGIDATSAALALPATVAFALTARYEERFNLQRFGSRYAEYMRRTKMFVPFIV